MFDEMSQLDNMGQDPTEQPDDIMALIMRMKQQEAQKQALAQQPPPSVMEMLMRQKQQRDAEQAATQQQALQQPTMMNQIYQRMAQENPERQAQLQQWQTQMPEDIAKANRDGYYGTGKFGRVIEAIAAATGVRPKFEQDALARYQRQQEQLKGEDVQNTKLAQAEIGATQRAQAAMMKQQTDERKRADLAAENATKAILAEQKNITADYAARQKAINDDALMTLKQKQLAHQELNDATKNKLAMLQRLQASVAGNGTGENLVRMAETNAGFKALFPDQPGMQVDEQTQRNFVFGRKADADQKGGVGKLNWHQTIRKNGDGSETIDMLQGGSGPASRPNTAAYDELARGIGGTAPIIDFNRKPQAAQQPQAQANPLMQAPAPPRPVSPALQQFVDPKAPKVEGTGVDLGEPGFRRMGGTTSTNGEESPGALRSFIKRIDNRVELTPPAGLPGVPPEKAKDSEAAMQGIMNGLMAGSGVAKSYALGVLHNKQGFWRNMAAAIRENALETADQSSLNKLSPEEQDFLGTTRNLILKEKAAYLNKISGAQVSEQEYNRIKKLYPTSTQSPEMFLNTALYNATIDPALARMAQAGIFLDKANFAKIAPVLKETTEAFSRQIASELESLRGMRLNPNSKIFANKLQAIQSKMTNTDALVADVLRKALPSKDGRISIKTPTHEIRIHVPHPIKVIDEAQRKMGIKTLADQAEEDLRKMMSNREDD